MKKFIAIALSAAMLSPIALPGTALAQHHYNRHDNRYDRNHRGRDYRWDGDRNDRWDPSSHYHSGNYRARRLTRNDRVYRGHDGRYYCRRNDGTTGLVVGAVAGGLLGNVVGGGTLGTLLGAGGGGLLGRSIDRGNVTCH